MIKPYFKENNSHDFVEVEDHGIINLSELPILANKDRCIEIGWTLIGNGDNKGKHVLSEYGGTSPMSFGGRNLGVTRVVGVDFAKD